MLLELAPPPTPRTHKMLWLIWKVTNPDDAILYLAVQSQPTFLLVRNSFGLCKQEVFLTCNNFFPRKDQRLSMSTMQTVKEFPGLGGGKV